ncbi:MAG: RHS repeat-associated core domain-containing protein, partial [Gemmatimonadales bacterium]
RGGYDSGTDTTGTQFGCAPTYSQGCPDLGWPGEFRLTYHNSDPTGAPPEWFGSLIQDKRDATGLMYMRNRYYDPATGRFTQQDPIGLAGGLNLYGFANGDPVNFHDPFGLSADTVKVDSSATTAVQDCRTNSAECASMLDSLQASTEYWEIEVGATGSCAPYIIGCTSYTPVAGHGPGGTIRIVPGEYNLVNFFVNDIAVVGHELGHAVYNRQPLCRGIEVCAINVEQVVRRQAGLPRRP